MRPLYTKLEATPLRFAECARIQKDLKSKKASSMSASIKFLPDTVPLNAPQRHVKLLKVP